MATRAETFSRLNGRVNLAVLAEAFVAIVGVGSVGSAIALELAKCGIGSIALCDGDVLEAHNLVRHVLPASYLQANKAEGMAHFLSSFPGLDVGALPRHLDESFTDVEIDTLLHPANLVVVATDRRSAQRRVGERTLALDKPTIVPALYPDERGGEVFVQLGPEHPCLFCWDAFRPADAEVRGVSALNADALDVIQQTVLLSLAALDPTLAEARDLAPTPEDRRPRQVFIVRPGAPLVRAPLGRTEGCPACRVGPSPLNHRRLPRRQDRLTAFMTAGRPSAADWSFVLGTSEPPAIEDLAVDASIVLEGGLVTVSWRTRNATYVEINGHGRFPTSGRLQTTIDRHTAFTVHAFSPLGHASASTRPVRVIPTPQLPSVTLTPLTFADPRTERESFDRSSHRRPVAFREDAPTRSPRPRRSFDFTYRPAAAPRPPRPPQPGTFSGAPSIPFNPFKRRKS